MVDEVTIDPNFDFFVGAFDDHFVPFAERFFGVVGEVEDASGVAFVAAPFLVFALGASFFHVGDFDVFSDAPEVASVFVVHLDFDRFGEHFEEVSGGG